MQIDPFFDGVGPSAMRPETRRWDSGRGEKGGVHPKALPNRFRAPAENLNRLAAQGLDDERVLRDPKRRPHKSGSVARLEIRILSRQVFEDRVNLGFDRR